LRPRNLSDSHPEKTLSKLALASATPSIKPSQRGIAFGFHRAADTGGAMLGILIAALVVWLTQSNSQQLGESTFRTVVLISLIPAVLGVLSLIIGARDVAKREKLEAPKITFKGLGKPFLIFLLIVGLFDLGNSSDAFLVLRAQERGMSVISILLMLASFNLVYALVSTPAGSLSDRVGRRKVIIGGWLVYGAIYLGFALAQQPWHMWALFILYGVYYGLAYGTAKAMVADLVSPDLRGTAYGTYNAILGILDFPASLIAGLLWQGVGGWQGFGPAAPFLFGGGLAILAAIALAFWHPKRPKSPAS
jgi:MFS family permease